MLNFLVNGLFISIVYLSARNSEGFLGIHFNESKNKVVKTKFAELNYAILK